MNHPYGHGFAVKVSKRRAKELSVDFDLPRLGYGRCIKEVSDGFDGFFLLSVDNVSGDYFLSSHNVERSRWASIFGVNGEKP